MLISNIVNGKNESTAQVEIADAMVYTSLEIRFDRTGFHRRKYSRKAARVAGYVRKLKAERTVTTALCGSDTAKATDEFESGHPLLKGESGPRQRAGER